MVFLNRPHAPGSVSISSGFGFLGGFAMATFPPENHDVPNLHISRMLELADYTPFLTEIGRLVYYWADFEFLFDKILYEIWKLEWAEPQPTHLKIGFNKRCDYWRMLAERRLANDPARKARRRCPYLC